MPEEKANVLEKQELKYERGNADDVIVTLLMQLHNKMDASLNHSEVLVEQNEEIITLLEKATKKKVGKKRG